MNRVIQSMMLPAICCLFTVLAISPSAQETPDIERGILERLDLIRAINVTSDREVLTRYSEELDEAWAFFRDNKEAALPILVRQLRAEHEKQEPNDYMLLDVGYFLYIEGEQDSLYREQALQSLYSLNPLDDVVRANQQQLFGFVHRVAQDRDPRVLEFIDRAFLRSRDSRVFISQHSLDLDATLVCVFLYGVYGQGAEEHLLTLLDDSELVNPIIEVLIWIGSDNSIDDVKKAMVMHPNKDAFVRGLTFMMEIGGASGREFMLGLDLGPFDDESQQYFESVKKAIEDMSFEAYRDEFVKYFGDSTLPADEVRKRLSDMYDNYGKDDNTSPAAVLLSELPKDFLIEELRKIRFRMFNRVSDEALSEVKVTNLLINALSFRTY